MVPPLHRGGLDEALSLSSLDLKITLALTSPQISDPDFVTFLLASGCLDSVFNCILFIFLNICGKNSESINMVNKGESKSLLFLLPNFQVPCSRGQPLLPNTSDLVLQG